MTVPSLFRPAVVLFLGLTLTVSAQIPTKPILYITQTPMPDETLGTTHDITQGKMSVVSAMQSPLADPAHAARGGALWIRYADGTRRNLTAAAGFGGGVDANGNASGFQGANGIVVQRPFVHWNGTKAVFAMVVGAPLNASDTTQFRWQLYEITNFAQGQTPVITLVNGQLTNYNNYQACYDTQDRIIFVSDTPRGLQTHLYPQLDEYLSLPCNTGLWRLDRALGQLKQIVHAPSGAFSPFIDSAGRVLFVQWDHLSRDTFATYDRAPIAANGDTWTQTFNGNGTVDSENVGATFTLGTAANYSANNFHPEPRNFDKTAQVELANAGVNVNGLSFNQFFPWECREDGSSHETQNHVGRHEFGPQVKNSFTDDPNLVTLNPSNARALNFLHVTESPTAPGTFYAVNPPEFGTHVAAPILRYNGSFGVNADAMSITYLTPIVNVPNPALGQSPLASPVDIYRSPTPLTSGGLMAVHAAVNQYDSNAGPDAAHPLSRYAFRLRMLKTSGNTMVPDLSVNLTSPANVTLSYYANGSLVTYSGAPLWELDPVEVIDRSATKPAQLASVIDPIEQTVFNEEGVHAPTFQNYLKTRDLALVVNRNSTRRDAADKQQPFNLKVAWSSTQTIGASGKIYDAGWLQLFQADALRAYTLNGQNVNAPAQSGRRIMPTSLHSSLGEMPVVANAPAGAVKLANDGSWAAVVPAGRAVSWQLLDGAGSRSQVKERYWVNFAPGEMRTCAVCHGVNTTDQAGNLGAPTNKPEALRTLLQFWKGNNPPGTLQHASATSSTLKNAGTAILNVTRIGGSTGPASVSFSTVDGSAVAGTDYTATTGTLNWVDGDSAPQTISIPLLNNPTIAASKTFDVTLSNPLYASLGTPALRTIMLSEAAFESWLFTNFNAAANDPTIGGATADPDGDGLSNLIEYFAGTIPAAHFDPAPIFAMEIIGGVPSLTLTFTHDPSHNDVSYHAQVSTNLISWNDLADSVVGMNGPLEIHKASVALSAATARFLRLQVTRP